MTKTLKTIGKGLLIILGLLVLLFVIVFVIPKPSEYAIDGERKVACSESLIIESWDSLEAAQAKGLIYEYDIKEKQNILEFDSDGDKDYATIAISSGFSWRNVVSRLTDYYEPDYPELDGCWIVTEEQGIVMEYTIRFFHDNPTFGLTSNQVLWKDPAASPDGKFTSFGMNRGLNPATGKVSYKGVIAEEAWLDGFEIKGFVDFSPVPEWLDSSEWHDIRITIVGNHGTIEVAQGEHDFTVFAEAELSQPPPALTFAVSIDSDFLPGAFMPVFRTDGFDIASVSIIYITP